MFIHYNDISNLKRQSNNEVKITQPKKKKVITQKSADLTTHIIKVRKPMLINDYEFGTLTHPCKFESRGSNNDALVFNVVST